MIDRLQTLIEDTAARTDGVGLLERSVKWGQPSCAPAKPRIGSSVRLQARDNGDVALMFICHTRLVEDFRELYGNRLVFEGNRAIVVRKGEPFDEEAVGHCIALALTYHLRKRGSRQRQRR